MPTLTILLRKFHCFFWVFWAFVHFCLFVSFILLICLLFFWGGGGHSLFVGWGVIASLFHRNELIIVFLDFLVFETQQTVYSLLSFDSYVNNQLGGIKIFVCYLLIQTHRHCQNRPCSNMPQAFGNDITSAFLIKTTKYINMNSDIHVYHGKTHSPWRPRVKIDRGVSNGESGQTHTMLWHTFLLFRE